MLKKFFIIITNTSRSLAYLKILKKNKIIPHEIIYLNNGIKNKFSIALKKKKFYFPKIKIKIFKNDNVSNNVSKYLLRRNIKNVIYSGYPAKIVKNKKTLKKLNFIHSHPGKLPEFKGSTTIYYSLLKYKKIFCSTIILNENIDGGKLLFTKRYPIPSNILSIDKKYDNLIRSKNLLYVLKNFIKLKPKKQKKNDKYPYHVIHPVLRSIVFKKIMN